MKGGDSMLFKKSTSCKGCFTVRVLGLEVLVGLL